MKFHYEPGRFWCRLRGFGFLIKDVRRYPLLFSQRQGKGLLLGHYYFGRLPSCL